MERKLTSNPSICLGQLVSFRVGAKSGLQKEFLTNLWKNETLLINNPGFFPNLQLTMLILRLSHLVVSNTVTSRVADKHIRTVPRRSRGRYLLRITSNPGS